MEYIPLIPEYANFLLVAGITFAITSAITFVLVRFSNTNYNDPPAALLLSTVIALVLGLSSGYTFAWFANVGGNVQIVKENVESKYDVSISNVEKMKGDDDASLFSAAMVNNKDQSARDITLLIAADGTPSIMDTDNFKAETVKR